MPTSAESPPAQTGSASSHDIIEFEQFRLAPSARLLTKNGAPVRIGARALDILIALVDRAGEVVSKEELLTATWPKIFVEESNLRVHISALRKALGDGQSEARFITGVPGRGYSFVAQVRRVFAAKIVDAAVRPKRTTDVGLPASLVRIIGRDEIVEEIATRIPHRRFITICGTGGVGKTAVAMAVADSIVSHYRDGVKFIDLALLADPLLVGAHLASLLRLEDDSSPLSSIVAYLRKKNMLLVLDNGEHVIDALGEIVEEILKWAPEVHVLTTSREPVRAMGEWVQRLSPLAVPPVSTKLTASEALRFPAVQLFAERLLANDASQRIDDDDAPIVADLCARLDGLPLAIELAVTRVPAFGLKGVADQLGDRFHLLTRGRRTSERRHQTLEAMIDWSYVTLSDEEKVLWRRIAVFSGTFTIEAANAVGCGTTGDTCNVADVLANLVEKSLISVDTRGAEVRYRLLESLRLYAYSKLVDHDEAECVRRRHATYFYERSLGSGVSWIDAANMDWLRKHSAGNCQSKSP